SSTGGAGSSRRLAHPAGCFSFPPAAKHDRARHRSCRVRGHCAQAFRRSGAQGGAASVRRLRPCGNAATERRQAARRQPRAVGPIGPTLGLSATAMTRTPFYQFIQRPDWQDHQWSFGFFAQTKSIFLIQHCRPLIERTKRNSKNSDILADVVSPLERVHQQDRAETVPLISTKDRKGSDVNGGKISVRDVVSLVVEELIRFLDFYCKRVEPVGSMSIPR